MEIAILGVGALVVLAHLFTALFERTRIPDVLLLILIGLVAGPVTGLVRPEHLGVTGGVFSTIALVVILFESGTGLDLEVLTRSLGPTLRLTLASFVATALIVFLVGYQYPQLPVGSALLAALILAGTSSAVVIPMVRSLGLSQGPSTVLILESALTDVLCLALVFGAADGLSGSQVGYGRMAGGMVAALVVATLLGALAAAAWLAVVERVRRLPNTATSSIAVVLMLYAVAELLGYSGPIAALMFGVALANSRKLGLERLPFVRPGRVAALTAEDREINREVTFLVKAFFFVYLGVSIPLGSAARTWIALLCVALVYLGRHLTVAFAAPTGTSAGDKAVMAVMAPKGLAAAVLGAVPLRLGLAGGEAIQGFTYLVVLFSIVATALLVWAQQFPVVSRVYARVFGPGGSARAPAKP